MPMNVNKLKKMGGKPSSEVKDASGMCHMSVMDVGSNATKLGKHKMTPVAIKAQHLMAEGKPKAAAFGEAFGMQRAGRLTQAGGYKRAKRG